MLDINDIEELERRSMRKAPYKNLTIGMDNDLEVLDKIADNEHKEFIKSQQTLSPETENLLNRVFKAVDELEPLMRKIKKKRNEWQDAKDREQIYNNFLDQLHEYNQMREEHR